MSLPATSRLFVKICGITSEEDALVAVAMGADALGFVFAPSVRQVSAQVVRDIVRRLPPDVVTVGVFRDDSAERIIETIGTAGLGGAQLHGSELPATTAQVAAAVGFTIKAFRAASPEVSRAREHPADAVLLDSDAPGSGRLFDWSLVEGIEPGMKLILAGGLEPDNVAGAVAAVRPWGVDVSSGVESSPGRKDASRLRSFIDAVRSTESATVSESTTASADGCVGEGKPPFDWSGV